MNNFKTLFAGELQRMKKYHILTASILVAFFWIGAIHLLEIGDISFLFAMVVYFDVVSMSIVMIGVTIFFEKQEGVLKTLFVSPINKSEFILAKILGNLVSNFITILIVYLYAIIFLEISISTIGLIGAVFLIGLFHSFIGFLIIYRSDDFTEMLIGMVMYFLIFMIPIILELFGVIESEIFSNLLFIIPTKTSAVLMEGILGTAKLWELMVSIIYLIAGSIILGYFVFKQFKNFAARESGV